MTFDLSSHVAVVTGAAQGIGEEIARELARSGASVVIADRHGEGAEAAAARLREEGFDAIARAVDVTVDTEVEALMAFAEGWRSGLSILVNNAAISTTAIIEETSTADWRRVIDINLTGPFLCSKAALPYMRARQRGKIVNVCSVAAKRISFNAGASYTASKAGLVAFTRHLAYEAAPDGINVNAVCPGPVMSPMLQRTATPETIAERRAGVPSGKISTPTDQARAVAYLVSDEASLVYGVALDVDGGALLGWYDTQTYFERRGAARASTSGYPA